MIHHAHHVQRKHKKELLDYFVYFFMIATPLFELPQAYAIYSTKDAANVSIWTWGFFLAASVVWIFYGLRHKLVPIVITYSLYFVLETVIVAGIIMYS